MNSKFKPKVSVVMSIYNSETTIVKSLESIINQTFKALEIILINDSSTDRSYDILKEYEKKDNRIKCYSNKTNLGLTKSLNIGISKCSTEFIVRQDSDDYSTLDRIEKQYKIINSDENIVLLGSQILEVKNNKKNLWTLKKSVNCNKMIKYKNLFAHSTVLFRRSVFNKVGKYDLSYKVSQDFELWMRMAQHGRVQYIYEPLVFRVFRENSISENKKFNQFFNSVRARFKHSQSSNLFLIIVYSFIQFIIVAVPGPILNKLKNILSK
jgi:glycosyltransferase involved in cell wall biosynthesis